jgi:hypothetical protein
MRRLAGHPAPRGRAGAGNPHRFPVSHKAGSPPGPQNDPMRRRRRRNAAAEKIPIIAGTVHGGGSGACLERLAVHPVCER